MKKSLLIVGIILVGIAIAISARIFFDAEASKAISPGELTTEVSQLLGEGKVQEIEAAEATEEDVNRAAPYRGHDGRKKKRKIKK